MKGSSWRSYARFFKRIQLWTQNLNSSYSYFGFTVSAFLSFTGWYKYNRFPRESHKTNKSQTPDIKNENNRAFSIGRSNERTQVRRFIFWYTQVCFQPGNLPVITWSRWYWNVIFRLCQKFTVTRIWIPLSSVTTTFPSSNGVISTTMDKLLSLNQLDVAQNQASGTHLK